MPYFPLEKHRDNLFRCLKCGSCHATCPTYRETLDESQGARGRLALIQALMDGKLRPSKALRERLSSCLSCMTCSANCANGVDAVRIITAAKEHIARREGLAPILRLINGLLLKNRFVLPALSGFISQLERFYNWTPTNSFLNEYLPFVREGKKRCFPIIQERRGGLSEWHKTKNPVAKVAYFTGCMTDLIYQDTEKAVLSFLKERDVDVWIPKKQLCCGAPAYYMGDWNTALDLMKHNLTVFEEQNVDAIITSCATCGNMLKNVYPGLLEYAPGYDKKNCFPEKVMDLHKFVNDKLSAKPHLLSQHKKSKTVKVTYHDPCHLNRGQKVSDEPRQLLKAIQGLEYVEMDNADACCGGSGLFNLLNYDLSINIGKLKAKAIKKTGADIVATGCPSCRMHLKDLLNREGVNIEVVHTIEILRRFSDAG